MPEHYRAAVATRRGTGANAYNADGTEVFRASDGTLAAALVDGIGHTARVSSGVRRMAWAAARLAAQLDGRSALVTVGRIVADPGTAEEKEPDGPAVVAVARQGEGVIVHWLGDCRAYGWDGYHLHQRTTDHTMGECLWVNAAGGALPEYTAHNNWVLLTLSRALPTTVFEVEIDDDLVLLTSDGVHDSVPHTQLESLVREHTGDPQTLADTIVAATPNTDGSRDDATAIVLIHHH